VDLAITSKTFGSDKLDWMFTEHGAGSALSITLKGTGFTGTYADGNVPSGVPLAKITATGLYTLYDNVTAAAGDVLAGFLLTPQAVLGDDGATHDVGGALLLHGFIKEAKLPAYWAALGGTNIAAGKVDVGSRLVFV